MTLFRSAILLAAALLLSGCLALESGRLEVLNPNHAYGQSLAVIGGLHGENKEIEERLASDLQNALAKRGLEVAADPDEADIVIVPTLGRMRERTPSPAAVVDETVRAEPAESAEPVEPVVAAPAPEARPFNRFSAAGLITRGDLVSRRAVPSARVPSGAQQAGLLLTGYRGEDFRDYGIGRQSLPPVWRIYVSQPAVQMKWKSVAVPLINAAASAAAPLGKSMERGARNTEQVEKQDETVAEQPESRAKEKKKRQQESEPKPAQIVPGQSTDTPGNEAPAEKRTFFGLFGGSSQMPASTTEGDDRQ